MNSTARIFIHIILSATVFLAATNPELVKEVSDAYTKWATFTGRKFSGVTRGKK